MNQLQRNRAGWGADWTDCVCGGEVADCPECDGEGGWPASATRFDDEEMLP